MGDDVILTDFVGVSQVALNAWVDADYVTPERFMRHLREHLRSRLLTSNQRRFLVAVLERCHEEHATGL